MGNWIREGRDRLGITQEQLAELEGKIREALAGRLPVPEDHKDGLKSRLESMAGKYGRACRDIKEKEKRILELEATIVERGKKIQELEDQNETLDLTWRDVQQDNETLLEERDELKKAHPIEQFRSVRAYEEAGREIHLAAIVDELRRANAELFDRVAKLQAENAILGYKEANR